MDKRSMVDSLFNEVLLGILRGRGRLLIDPLPMVPPPPLSRIKVLSNVLFLKSMIEKRNNWVKGKIRSCGFLRIFTYTDDFLS